MVPGYGGGAATWSASGAGGIRIIGEERERVTKGRAHEPFPRIFSDIVFPEF
jgi:hypothetical protein